MSKLKHTPGPWSFRTNPNYSLDFFGGGIAMICNVRIANQDANACLIAAAPELLETLLLCYDHCRLHSPEVERNNVGEAVRAAIKKATGA